MSGRTRHSQFRDYLVKLGEMEEWLDEWHARLYPIRTRRGFRILAAWVIPESNRFQWVIKWEGEGSFEEADRSYYASPEREKVQPDPARHLEKADHFFIDPVVEEGKWTRMNRRGQRSGPKVSPTVADPHPTAD